MEHKTKSEIEDTETLERNLKLTKLALVIVCISALLAVTAVYYGMQQNITQERKSVLGQIYSQNKEAGKLYAEAILINSVNSENEQAGVRAMDAMLYTRDAFDNVSIVYPSTLCMAGGTFCGLLVVIGIAVVYILCRKGAEQWIAEKKGNRQLCVRLDGMNEALQGKNRQIQTFIENVAHQIRTPVSLLYLNIEDIPDEDKRNNCMQSLERVKGLIQCLLRISRMEAGAVIMEKRDYDLADIMEGICNQYDSSELLFENSSSGKAMAHIDEEWFVESVSNTINNGHEHSDGSSPVQVTLDTNKEQVEIRVVNVGNPMNPEDIPYIFDRFYTAGNVLLSHTGIGLNMAQLAIRQMDGDIRLHVEGGRTEFVIILRRQALTEKIDA